MTRPAWSGPWLGAAATLAVALLLAACGGNPNENIDANEFFRPSAMIAELADDTGAGDAAARQDGSDREPEAGTDSEEPGGDGDAPEPQAPAATSDDGAADDIDLADDIIRRYLNDTYGYSLELVCGPFCNATSNGIDRVGFLSDSGMALINISVRSVDEAAGPTLAALQAIWESEIAVNESFAILERSETTLTSDGVTPSLLLAWQIDRRATGGFLERYLTLITQVGPVAYFVSAGAVDDAFDEVEPYFIQSLDSFIARAIPPSVPGAYTKWDFVFPYDEDSFNGETGNLTQLPSFDSGVFIQQSPAGPLEFLLIWEAIGEALFNLEEALTTTPLTFLAGLYQLGDEVERGELTVGDGIVGRFALVEATDFGGAVSQVATYAWYCVESGQSFTLLSLSPNDARTQAQLSLDGFRCSAP